jgi:hypothetical protein
MRLFRFIAILAMLMTRVCAEEPFFKKGDVIALVGGEDMVAASEYGYLELLLTRALPDYHLKFRNLAWEGDTVFEQPRQLNFPTWEQQLEKIGATVVICQFGQMESLAGKEKLGEFVAAYKKLLDRFSGGGKRRLILIAPSPVTPSEFLSRVVNQQMARNLELYSNGARAIAREPIPGLDPGPPPRARFVGPIDLYNDSRSLLHDGRHLSSAGHKEVAYLVGHAVDAPVEDLYLLLRNGLDRKDHNKLSELLSLIVAKNRLWFDYWRPQNWAFLNGDRTTQPSSRDHRDPNVRWFPAEMEQFLPLIAAKEEEIWKLAGELN